MSGTGGRRRIDADEVRALFRRAAEAGDSPVERMIDGVPAAIAEAARRRRTARPRTVTDAVVPLGARWLPATAVITAALVIAALFADGAGTPTANADPSDGLDRLVLIGSLGTATDDPLLRALVPSETDDE